MHAEIQVGINVDRAVAETAGMSFAEVEMEIANLAKKPILRPLGVRHERKKDHDLEPD